MENPIIENVLYAGWEAELSKLAKILDDLATKAEKINVGLSAKGGKTDNGQVEQIKQLNLVVKEYDATTKRMQATIKEMEAQKQKEITISAQLNAATTKEAYNIAALTAAKREATRTTTLLVQAQTNAAGSGKALSAQISLNTIELSKYSEAQIKASARLQKLQADTENLRNAKKRLKEATGDYTDNVGNYTTAISGTTKTMNSAYNSTFQMTQVMRELPNFAIDARIGFMSLSNNLPMLYDGFKQLATQMDAVTGKAKGWGYAWKTMGASLLSMNTIMIVGVTLLTMYGKDIVNWIGTLFKGEKAIKSLVNAQGQLHEAQRKGIDDAQTEKTKLDALYGASQDNKRSMDERKMAVDELQKKYPKYFGNLSDESILLGQGKISYDNLTESLYRNAIARASLDRITENSRKALTLQEQISWKESFIIDAEEKKASIEKYRRDRQDLDFGKAMYKELTTKIKFYGEQLATHRKELDAVNKSNEKLKDGIEVVGIIEQTATTATGENTKSVNKQAEAYNRLALEMEAAVNVAKDLADSDELSFDERAKSAWSWFNLRYDIAVEDEKIQLDALQKEYDAAVKTTTDRKKLDEWYAQQKERITLTSTNSFIAIEVEYQTMLDKINKDETKSEEEKQKAIQKLNDDTLKAKLAGFDVLIAEANKKVKEEIEIEKRKEQAKQDIIRESINAIGEISDALFQIQLDNYEEESKRYEKTKDDELNVLEQSHEAGLISDEQYNSEKAAKEAYYASIQEEIGRKQFELEKRQKEAQIGMDLAMSIMSIWAEWAANPVVAGVLTGIVAAVAGTQVAAIEAAEYADGGIVLGNGQITESPNIRQRSSGDNILAYVKQGETILNTDQVLALGGAYAMKMAGVPGYEDARYQPDMSDIRTGYKGKGGNIVVNANFESEKIVKELRDIKKSLSKTDSDPLMNSLKSRRYANR